MPLLRTAKEHGGFFFGCQPTRGHIPTTAAKSHFLAAKVCSIGQVL